MNISEALLAPSLGRPLARMEFDSNLVYSGFGIPIAYKTWICIVFSLLNCSFLFIPNYVHMINKEVEYI